MTREITEPRWHCVTRELVTEQGLTVGIAALQIVVGAFRKAKRSEGPRKRKGEGAHRAGAKLADHHDLCVYHVAFLPEVQGALGSYR